GLGGSRRTRGVGGRTAADASAGPSVRVGTGSAPRSPHAAVARARLWQRGSRAARRAGAHPLGRGDHRPSLRHRVLRVGGVTVVEPVQFMSHHTAVEYKVPEPSLLSIHFGQELAKGRIIGHKCPQCGKVYMPPRGYCPLCVDETTEADEVEVANVGTITTFSVITPLQYQGQEETEDYVQATLLLDGADTTIMVMRMDGIAIGD